MNNAVIVDVVRTASGRGKPGGALSGTHPVDLLARVISEIVTRNGLDPLLVDDVIAGCVGQVADQSLNIARIASLASGLPESVPGTTIDRQCGSSQQAVHFAAQGIMAGAYDIVIACGVESMSRVPMGKSAVGGDAFSPLRRRYPDGLVNQGLSAELIASRWGLTREEIDEFAARSHQLATMTEESGLFASEVVPVTVVDGDGVERVHMIDETVRSGTTVAGLAELKPSFYAPDAAARFPQIGWHVTPGNSSPLTDGASAALIMSEKVAARLGLNPRAQFRSFSVTGSDPLLMLTGVILATEKALAKSGGLTIDDMDAFEVNEAFAPVPLVWQREVNADPEKVNPRGGAIALGHALGSSGTRLLCTLINQLEATGGRYGLQTMCEGGGMANGTIIERL